MTKEKGNRVRQYFISEVKVLLEKYKRIESLLPSEKRSGSSHSGEEGRFAESLMKEFLNKHLPKSIRAITGFIYRPATKTGQHDRTRRRKETDKHSKQLDIIVFDFQNYPTFESFEDFYIVPPEGVISIISVKKNLYKNQLKSELKSLAYAASLCSHYNNAKEYVRGPNTAIVSFSHKFYFKWDYDRITNEIFDEVKKTHISHSFDQCISQLISLNHFSIFKTRPVVDKDKRVTNAKYVSFKHEDEAGQHFGLQFLLTGILSVHYDKTRNLITRPGYTSFPTDRKHDKILGEIDVTKLR